MASRLLAPFWNAAERRPRALWRVLVQSVLVLALGFAAGQFLSPAVATLATGPAAPVVSGVIPLAVVLASVAAAGYALDDRPLRDFGLRVSRGWWMDLGFGLALGAALQSGVFAVEYALGWVRVTGTLVGSPATGLPALLVLFVCVGVYEEVLSRGYQLTNAAEGLRAIGEVPAVTVATLLTASLFGALHYTNPAASVRSSALVAVGGVFLGLGYVLTGELAVPIGFHVTWNFFQGAVWGFPVSGLAVGTSVVAVDQRGPALFTGGRFGPEAGLVGLAALAVGTAVLVAYVAWRRGDVGVHPNVVTPERL
ncbi:MAG: lysostaphin resistance A-like protein [Halobacteriaceae archaeon]